jgi:hypothetical protein
VKVTNNTVFDGNTTTLAGLLVGNQIEVYGLPQADGSFVATRIESYAETSGAFSGVALRGIVASTTAGNDSFTLANGVNVSYSADKVVPKARRFALALMSGLFLLRHLSAANSLQRKCWCWAQVS